MTESNGVGSKPGRRPRQSKTKEAILASARTRFARSGFDTTSIRSVAADTGVDSALVHHYFGTKRGLFIAAIALPADPAEVLEPVAAADNDDLGRALATAILGVWDSEDDEAVIAAFRSMNASGDTTLIGTFLLQVALRDVAKRVDSPVGSALERVNLVASQMAGLLLTRHILALEPLASMPVARVVDWVSPILQRYLTGPMPDGSD